MSGNARFKAVLETTLKSREGLVIGPLYPFKDEWHDSILTGSGASRKDVDSEKTTLDSQTLTSPYIRPSIYTPGYTTPSLWSQLAILLRPLSKAGRKTRPLWFLATRQCPWDIATAPPGSPFAERMKRHCVRSANALLWPIARLLSALMLAREGIDRPVALACWREIDARGCANRSGGFPTSSSVPFSPPTSTPKPATRTGAIQSGPSSSTSSKES